MHWSVVTLVAAHEKYCLPEPFKTIQAVRVSKFIWQRVPDCRASVVERLTAARAESTARHSETVPRLADRRQRQRGAASEAGMR